MQQTDVELLAEAAVIAEETTAGANTADRIGTMLENIIDSKVNNDSIPVGTVVTVKRTLSSAEILAGFATPISIVAAPGAGKYIRVLSALYRLNFGTAAYAAANTSTIHFTGSTANLVTANTAILPGTANAINQVSAIAATFATGSDDPVNKAVEWSVSGNNPTTGDSTIDVYLTYVVVTL
jgi:hypothetical protein